MFQRIIIKKSTHILYLFTAPPTADPLEPIGEELERARDDANLYIYLTYACAGILGLILLVMLYLVWYNMGKRSLLEKQIAAENDGTTQGV